MTTEKRNYVYKVKNIKYEKSLDHAIHHPLDLLSRIAMAVLLSISIVMVYVWLAPPFSGTQPSGIAFCSSHDLGTFFYSLSLSYQSLGLDGHYAFCFIPSEQFLVNGNSTYIIWNETGNDWMLQS